MKTNDNGYSLAEALPAVVIFTLASAALLSGLSALLKLTDHPAGVRGECEALAPVLEDLSRILSEAGSDPWEPPPRCSACPGSEDLEILFVREGREISLRLRPLDSGLETILDHEVRRLALPFRPQLIPLRDDTGILRGITLRGRTKGCRLVVPFGRQVP